MALLLFLLAEALNTLLLLAVAVAAGLAGPAVAAELVALEPARLLRPLRHFLLLLGQEEQSHHQQEQTGPKAATRPLILLPRKVAAVEATLMPRLAVPVVALVTGGLVAPHQQTLLAKETLAAMALIATMVVVVVVAQMPLELTEHQAPAQAATENLLL
jgi:hypothetical protein